MNVVVYADESGTHDKTGKKSGSKVAIVAGFAAPLDEWAKFCDDWKDVLAKYQISYFHFKEWAVASAIVRKKREPFSEFVKKNSYRTWDLKKLDDFVYSLAAIAGAGNKIPIVGSFHTEKYYEVIQDMKRRGLPVSAETPYRYCLSDFFRSFAQETAIQWPGCKETITFIFDQTKDKEWITAIHEGFNLCKSKDARVQHISFGDKTEDIPLQAADMAAYIVRQSMEKYVDNGNLEIQSLERLVFRNLEASIKKLHPFLNYENKQSP